MNDEYLQLRQVVPDVPDKLLDKCALDCSTTRDQLIIKHRISVLIPIIKSTNYPVNLLPAPAQCLTVIHRPPVELMLHVTPQQIQYITILIEYIYNHSLILVKALLDRYNQPFRNDFYFMCYSAIPSIFGFFTSQEHLAAAFPFYCTVVRIMKPPIAQDALLPFYCSACTFRYIESIFDRFGSKFCHDIRLDSETPQKKIYMEYLTLFITSVEQSLPLLPQQHQFLFRYMDSSGWPPDVVMHFFLHKFTLPQLLRYVKGTPFKNHFMQLKHFAVLLLDNRALTATLRNTFDTPSVYAVPSAFQEFDLPYMQLLTTPLDIHVVIRALSAIQELPPAVVPFVQSTYFDSIDYDPFWIRIYNRKPKPVSSRFNWRYVVFNECRRPEPTTNADFDRMWRQLKSTAMDDEIDPIALLSGQDLPFQLRHVSAHMRQALGDRACEFERFALTEAINELNDKAGVFERYLQHLICLKNLQEWLKVVKAYYRVLAYPISEEHMEKALSHISPAKLAKDPAIFSALLDDGVIKSKSCQQMNYMMLVQHILPIIMKEIGGKLADIEVRWKKMIDIVRADLELPARFKRGQKAVLLNRQLWNAIEHLKLVDRMPFASMLRVFFDALQKLHQLALNEEEDTIYQWAVAFCDTPKLITRFLIINSYVVKQKRFHEISNNDDNLFEWCQFETAILKLLSHDEDLLTSYLSLMA